MKKELLKNPENKEWNKNIRDTETEYFDPIVLNNLIYGPGISITPIKQETYNCNYSTGPPKNFNPFNGYNGYNQLLSHLGQAEMKNTISHSPALQNTYPDVGGESAPRENILDCLPKKSIKRKSEKPTPRIGVEKNSQQAPIELDEPIHCEVCNETYKNNVAFALHSAKHSEDGKYTCHLCDYRNASKYHIEMHIRAHEGTTKYKCEICGKAFTVSTHAIEHKYFHTGEKPFQCEICGKHFMFSWFLTSHRRTQHWEIMTGSPLVKYDCTICNKHYTSSTGLKRHNLSKHNATEKTLKHVN
ncbi:hypothetical protein NQ318_020892 [Aromia moschata]|uniref:C2H2-type domain-containing protein n=1 Tax=Aromia moschata TaxID=1265417 RepID=A0AAV8XZB3_9CUCU|nr:hypothetical protein NQ318_020892 [Aromia moschata]